LSALRSIGSNFGVKIVGDLENVTHNMYLFSNSALDKNGFDIHYRRLLPG